MTLFTPSFVLFLAFFIGKNDAYLANKIFIFQSSKKIFEKSSLQLLPKWHIQNASFAGVDIKLTSLSFFALTKMSCEAN